MSRVIVITGASSGIGAELARQLAVDGASQKCRGGAADGASQKCRGGAADGASQKCRLALAARRMDRLEALAAELKDRYGTEVSVHQADVAQPSQVAALMQTVKDRWGRLDVLVNNAGVLKMQPFLDMPGGDMHYLMDVNFWGPVHAVRAAAPIMAAQGGGHIIQVGSGVSRRGLPFMAVYSATKFALAGLTEAVRLELRAKGIDFTMVYPGGVETEMPASVDVAKLPPGYPRHPRARISAARAARAIRKAIESRPLEVYVPWWVRFAAWMSAVCPPLADALVRKSYKEALWRDSAPQ